MFKTPNVSTAAFAAQSVKDSTTTQAENMANGGTYAISGLTATAAGGREVTIAAGSYQIAYVTYELAESATANFSVGSTTGDRRDIVVGTKTGTIEVVAGEPCTTVGWIATSLGLPPVKPVIPNTTCILYEVYVPGNATTLSSENLTDKRVVEAVPLLAANNGSDIESASTFRTNLGLGSAATQSSSAFDASGAAASAETAAKTYAAAQATAAKTAAETYATGLVATERTRAEAAEATKAPSATPTLTGTVTVPTAGSGDSSTKAASTAFVADGFMAGTLASAAIGQSIAVVAGLKAENVTDELHVARFGAKGNGTTDDTLAIISAFTAAATIAAAGGSPAVVFDPPAKHYLVGGYKPTGVAAKPGVNCLPFVVPSGCLVRMAAGWNETTPAIKLASTATLPTETLDGATWKGPAAIFASVAWCTNAPSTYDKGIAIEKLSITGNLTGNAGVLTDGTLTNGSATITGIASTAAISIGEGVIDWTTRTDLYSGSAPDVQTVVTAKTSTTVTISSDALASGTHVLAFCPRWHAIALQGQRHRVKDNFIQTMPRSGIVITNASANWTSPTPTTSQEHWVTGNKIRWTQTHCPPSPFNTHQHGIWFQKLGGGVTDSMVDKNIANYCAGTAIRLDSGADVFTLHNHPYFCGGLAQIYYGQMSGSTCMDNVLDQVGSLGIAGAVASGSNNAELKTFTGTGTLDINATPTTKTCKLSRNSKVLTTFATVTGILPGMWLADKTSGHHAYIKHLGTEVVSVTAGAKTVTITTAPNLPTVTTVPVETSTDSIEFFAPPIQPYGEVVVTSTTPTAKAVVQYTSVAYNVTGFVTALLGCTFLGELRKGGSAQASGNYKVSTGALVSQVSCGIHVQTYQDYGTSAIWMNKPHSGGNGHGTLVGLEIKTTQNGTTVLSLVGNRCAQDQGFENVDGYYPWWLSSHNGRTLNVSVLGEVLQTVATGTSMTPTWMTVGAGTVELSLGGIVTEGTVSVTMSKPATPLLNGQALAPTVFKTSGTSSYAVTDGTTYRITCVGGGGGGGGGATSAGAGGSGGSGGGSGAFAQTVQTATASGTVTVKVGAGGAGGAAGTTGYSGAPSSVTGHGLSLSASGGSAGVKPHTATTIAYAAAYGHGGNTSSKGAGITGASITTVSSWAAPGVSSVGTKPGASGTGSAQGGTAVGMSGGAGSGGAGGDSTATTGGHGGYGGTSSSGGTGSGGGGSGSATGGAGTAGTGPGSGGGGGGGGGKASASAGGAGGAGAVGLVIIEPLP